MLSHFFSLNPAGAAVHECYVAAVAVTGSGNSPFSIGTVRQVLRSPYIELTPAA